MTDYIAVLLAQQEEQEQGEAPELETGPLALRVFAAVGRAKV